MIFNLKVCLKKFIKCVHKIIWISKPFSSLSLLFLHFKLFLRPVAGVTVGCVFFFFTLIQYRRDSFVWKSMNFILICWCVFIRFILIFRKKLNNIVRLWAYIWKNIKMIKAALKSLSEYKAWRFWFKNCFSESLVNHLDNHIACVSEFISSYYYSFQNL